MFNKIIKNQKTCFTNQFKNLLLNFNSQFQFGTSPSYVKIGNPSNLLYKYIADPKEHNKLQQPSRIGLLGFGAIGKCFTDIVLENHPDVQIVALDQQQFQQTPTITKKSKFKYIQQSINKENINQVLDTMGLQKGDILIDLSTDINFQEIWTLCAEQGVSYINTAMEQWSDKKQIDSKFEIGSQEYLKSVSFPQDTKNMYKVSLGYSHEIAESIPYFKNGPTSIFECGANPGLISHFVKIGIEDAAQYFLTRPDFTDIDHNKIKLYLQEKNYPKLAQTMGLHTIHCSEKDHQLSTPKPRNMKKILYNTWSCQGFLTEGLVPIQVAMGSHENVQDTTGFYPRVNTKSGKMISSWVPSNRIWAKSWVPDEEISGMLIPHGEAYSINEYFTDKETGYSPSQYYVYQINPYCYEYIRNLPLDSHLGNTNPKKEVLHPMNGYKMKGYDKLGAYLIFNNNRSWWCGTIMDEHDASPFFYGKYGPTVIQVASGVYAGMQYIANNPNKGATWPDYLDSQFILERSLPYLGRFVSVYKDTTKTNIKDCQKFEDFLDQEKSKPDVMQPIK